MKPYDATYKVTMPIPDDCTLRLIDLILSRRSVSPKWVDLLEPTLSDIKQMISAAISAPDHDSLCPWQASSSLSDNAGAGA
jgi:hypothetical protein